MVYPAAEPRAHAYDSTQMVRLSNPARLAKVRRGGPSESNARTVPISRSGVVLAQQSRVRLRHPLVNDRGVRRLTTGRRLRPDNVAVTQGRALLWLHLPTEFKRFNHSYGTRYPHPHHHRCDHPEVVPSLTPGLCISRHPHRMPDHAPVGERRAKLLCLSRGVSALLADQ
jgi:hypothetical protein